MTKNSFLIYLDYEEQFDLLSDEELGQLMRAIMQYEKTGEDVKLEGMIKMAFSFIKTQLDRDREKYESKCNKNKENGARGGRPKKEKLKTISENEIPEGEIKNKHFLYFIYDNVSKQYKIGKTKNLHQRIYDIKRPTKNLVVIDYYLGTSIECQKYEKEILEIYKEYSIGGDWFKLPDSKVEEILNNYFSKKANGFSEKQMVSKKPDNDNEDDNDNDIDNDLLSKEEKEEKLEERFESCLNSKNKESIEECKRYLDKLPYSVINWVLVRTSGIEKPNWNYAKTVLEDFLKRKIDSLNKIELDQQKYKSKAKKKSMIPNFTQREYSKDFFESLYANIGG